MSYEFKKASVLTYKLTIDYTWHCPHCGKVHEVKNYSPSPYNAVAEDMGDVQCEGGCEEFSTLDFYSND